MRNILIAIFGVGLITAIVNVLFRLDSYEAKISTLEFSNRVASERAERHEVLLQDIFRTPDLTVAFPAAAARIADLRAGLNPYGAEWAKTD